MSCGVCIRTWGRHKACPSLSSRSAAAGRVPRQRVPRGALRQRQRVLRQRVLRQRALRQRALRQRILRQRRLLSLPRTTFRDFGRKRVRIWAKAVVNAAAVAGVGAGTAARGGRLARQVGRAGPDPSV